MEVVPQKYAIGYKNITVNDQFFNGHFPERAIMPGARAMRPRARPRLACALSATDVPSAPKEAATPVRHRR